MISKQTGPANDAGDLCTRLSSARYFLTKDLVNSGFAVHTILPGKGRCEFEDEFEDPLPLVDLYVLPFYDSHDKLRIMAAGFSRGDNVFAYDLSLGLSEHKSISTHRRLSALKNPVLAEEAVEALERFEEPFEITDVLDSTPNSIWDAFNPATEDARIVEWAEAMHQGKKVVAYDEKKDRHDFSAVQFDDESMDLVPIHYHYNKSSLYLLANKLDVVRTIIADIADVDDHDNDQDYLKALRDRLLFLKEPPVDTPPGELERYDRFMQYLPGGTKGNTVQDQIVRLIAITESDGPDSVSMLSELRRYKSSKLVCLPSRKGSRPLQLFRKTNLGREVYFGSKQYQWKSKFTLVKGTAIPPLKEQWQQYFSAEPLYVRTS